MKIVSILLFVLVSLGIIAQEEMFHGGFADGYGKIEINNQLTLASKGGLSDGYILGQLNDDSTVIGQGGSSDGYALGSLSNQIYLVSRGGYADGYHGGLWVRKYWTGAISFDWHNSSNWSDGLVPNSADEVIIPAECLFYPVLAGQILRIGESGIQSDFNSKSIWVQNNALLTSSSNTWLENSNLLKIDGQLFWKNISLNSIKNKPGAQIIVGSTGVIQVRQ